MDTDVIIVGAGPTGLSLACQFIRYGVDFVIVEREGGVTQLSKALGTQSRTMEIYEQMGLAQTALERGSIASKIRLISGGKVHEGFDLSAMGEGISPYPYMTVLEQSKTEQMLYEYLRSHQQEVWWNTTLEGFSQDANGVRAQVKRESGEVEEITAKYLVGCDGAKSQVRKQLGLSLVGDTFPHTFYVADVEMKSPLAHDTLHSVPGKDSFIFFFPMSENDKSGNSESENGESESDKSGSDERWRILGSLPDSEVDITTDDVAFTEEDLVPKVKELIQLPIEISETNWFSTYKVHTRRVDKFSSGRCYLAGDSAHIHTPAGGQGMNTGIQDAYNLAWKLSFVLKGYAEKSLLDSYDSERLENAIKLVESTDRMFELEAGNNPIASFFRVHILPSVAKYIFGIRAIQKVVYSMVSQTGIGYPESKLSLSSGDSDSFRNSRFKVKAGDRAPYFLIESRSIYDWLHAPKFHLLTFGADAADRAELAAQATQRYAEIMDYHAFPMLPSVIQSFGSEDAFTVLLRPDNYVAFITKENALDTLTQYFKAIKIQQKVVA